MRRFLLLLAALTAFTAGCAGPAVAPETARWTLPAGYDTGECWSENIAHAEALWWAEARTRFPNPYVFVCHGGPVGPLWLLDPDDGTRRQAVRAKAWALHRAMPDRDIVLIVCNAGGADIDVPRVWYAKRKVGTYPLWARGPLPVRLRPDLTWSIWEFRCGAPVPASTRPAVR